MGGNLSESRRIEWKRRLVEAATITLSILVAFGIDAWWDGVRERAFDQSHLASVLRELRTTAELLDDAIRLHSLTQDQASAVLEMTSLGRASVPSDSLNSLVVSLLNSYVINPPTGALEAATLSGTIARLEDEALKSQLLGWDGLLQDLLEEELAGSDNARRFLRFMSSRISLRGPYSVYGQAVSGEMVSPSVLSLPSTRHSIGVEDLLDDMEFENEVLTVLFMARWSRDEAEAFRGVLDSVIERLEVLVSAGA